MGEKRSEDKLIVCVEEGRGRVWEEGKGRGGQQEGGQK